MPFSELEKAKIIVKVTELNCEAEKLERRAGETADMFYRALATYGSELAGQPASIEADTKLALSLKEKANFLECICHENLELANIYARRMECLNEILSRIAKLRGEAEKLETEKNNKELEILYLRELKNLLA